MNIFRQTQGLALSFCLMTPALGQTLNRNNEMENSPWISARAAGLSQAISPTATALDAAYYNPSLIGGVREKGDTPILTHLYMPYIGTSARAGSQKLMNDRLQGESLSSETVAEDLNGVWNGETRYARTTLTPSILLNRFLLAYSFSSRTSAEKDETDPAIPLIHVSEQTVSGPLIGFSATAPKEEFYLGVTAAFLSINSIDAAMTQTDFASKDLRKSAFKTGKETYSGMPIHIGSAYRFDAKIKPTLTAVVHDIGGTRYSPSDKSKETSKQNESTTLGFSLSPQLGNAGTLHLITEISALTQNSVDFSDKLRASLEFTVGQRYGADAGFSIRTGYTSAGMSYGLGMNLGMIHAEIASFAEDIGNEDAKVIERKSILNVGFNIADY